jgi:hypothetical protein
VCVSSVEFIICDNINIDYLKDSSRKKQLNTLLLSFNIFSIIDFPTRSHNKSTSPIDNIFIDYTQSGKYLTWNIVKYVTGKNLENKLPLSVCINGALTEN